MRRHFLKTRFNSSKSIAAKRSFWADFKSSREAIAGMVTSKFRRAHSASILRPALRDYGGQVAHSVKIILRRVTLKVKLK